MSLKEISKKKSEPLTTTQDIYAQNTESTVFQGHHMKFKAKLISISPRFQV